MLFGPIVVRLIFEFLMMALLLVRNVISINNKLRAPGEQSDDADYFGDDSDLDELRQLIRSRVANRAQKPAFTRSHPADDAGAAAPEAAPEDTPSHVDPDGDHPDLD